MNITPHTIQHIPFNQFTPWQGNVRRMGVDGNINELAASISAHGLLQPIVVKQNENGGFSVISGRRRFLALQHLVKEGKFSEDAPVSCTLIENNSNDTEISLVENVMQLPMHPADKFEAFRALADKGMQVADIAVRFGISEATVFKLLKLGCVSPEVMTAYRDERINYAQVQAFTISDDAAEQNRVLTHILQQSWRSHPNQIRAELAKGEVAATDKRVQFVGLDFYEMCGGPVRRDLFDDRNSGYVQDIALLDTLVENKVQATITELEAQGWQWAEFVQAPDWRFHSNFTRLSPEEREFTENELQEYTPLVEKFQIYQDEGFDEEDEAIMAEINALDARIQAMHDSLYIWTPELKSASGVLISLERDGSLKLDYGLVPAGGMDPEETEKDNPIRYAEQQKPQKQKPEFSASLHRDLTQYRTAALRIELSSNPAIALAAVVHSLMVRVFYPYEKGKCVKISGAQQKLFTGKEKKIPSVVALEEACSHWSVPEDAADLWDWCIKRTQEDLLQLLALCTAHSIDAIGDKAIENAESRHADQLAAALNLDMRKWFSATAENCFNRISRCQILQAYSEVTGEEPSNGLLELKKKDLAIRAERELGGKWLPSILRAPEPDEHGKAA